MKRNVLNFLNLCLTVCLGLGLTVGLAFAGVNPDQLKPPAPGHTQILTLDDGSTLNGAIVSVEGGEVTFESSVGTMTIPIYRIVAFDEVGSERIRKGDYWFPNPNRTRMYIGPTGHMLPKGEGYFADMYVFFPSAAYGLTDNITLSAGLSLFPGLNIDEQLVYFMPKVGLAATENISLAVSGIILVVPDWADDDDNIILSDDDQATTVGVIFGVGTIGDEDKSITAGVGFGYYDDDIADNPAIIVGGEYRVGRRLSLVSENWLMPGIDPPLISYGVRFFGEGMAIDLALLNVGSEDAIFPGIPYIDFVWNF